MQYPLKKNLRGNLNEAIHWLKLLYLDFHGKFFLKTIGHKNHYGKTDITIYVGHVYKKKKWKYLFRDHEWILGDTGKHDDFFGTIK